MIVYFMITCFMITFVMIACFIIADFMIIDFMIPCDHVIKIHRMDLFILPYIMNPKQVQPQRIGDNAEAGQTYGRCTEHRV